MARWLACNFILLALFGNVRELSANRQSLVRGTVRDPSGAVVPGASVYLRGTDILSVSGGDGRFELSGSLSGDATLVATCAGFRAFEQRISMGAEPITVDVTFEIEGPFEQVHVTAQTSNPTPPAQLKLATLDVLKTPGTEADPMRAAQMFPGVVKVDEGAGLFVRGGDVSETATYLDHARLFHPYRYETPTGGFFGTVDPYLISGLSLATGAFPARYGDALSGVLELTGLESPRKTSISASLGLGAVSASLALPLNSQLGLRFSGNQTFSRLLYEVNPSDQHFERFPSGSDLNLSFYADSAGAGRFKVSAFTNREQVGVELQQDSFTGILDSESRNRLFSFNWQKTLDQWLLEVTLSSGAYREKSSVGVLDLTSNDSGERIRLDVTRYAAGWTVRTGVEAERRGAISQGTIPSIGGDLGGIQGTRPWSIDQSEWRAGGYSELERTFGRFSLDVGARLDRFQALRAWGADPRATVTYALTGKQHFHLGWGIYHQVPLPVYLNREDGNPLLQPMHSQHLVAGYEYGEESGPVFLRVEVYTKKYGRLPLQDAVLNFNDKGSGSARGVDFFLKLAPSGPWQGWVSYSYLNAMRLYTPFDDFQRYDIPTARFRPDFDIPHTLQLVLQRTLTASVSLGASLRIASGKPFTPVVGSLMTPGGFLPVFGPINSGRLPLYQRLDFSLSKSCTVAREIAMILYLGATNVMDHKNVLGYVYSSDYSHRSPAEGAWGRTFYFGMSFQR
ncbi:MAG: TonB-dependent receptor [Acidobacteriota bacterium]